VILQAVRLILSAVSHHVFHIFFVSVFSDIFICPIIQKQSTPAQKKPLPHHTRCSSILLLILGISLQLLTTCILRLIDTYRPELLTSYHERVQRSFSINNGIIRICTVTLLAPIAEEFAFRGVALKLSVSAFHTKHAALCAILFTAFCFGCYHGNVVQFCYSVPAGIILGCLAVWSGSLIPGMILHIILNASSYVIGSIAISASILWGIIGITCILIMICMKLIRRSI